MGIFQHCPRDGAGLAVGSLACYPYRVGFPGKLSEIDWRRPSVVAMLLANLVPVFGVVLLRWEIFPLIFLFWSENVIVGVFNVLRMIAALPSKLALLPMIPFFCVHYGMFTFGHGIFVIVLFGGGMKPSEGSPDVHMFWRIMVENHLGLAVLGLAVSHGISFVTNYIGRGEYRRITPQQLMTQPYGRIVVMHLAILGGGFLIQALKSPLWALLLLIVLKTGLDLTAHVRERRNLESPPETA